MSTDYKNLLRPEATEMISYKSGLNAAASTEYEKIIQLSLNENAFGSAPLALKSLSTIRNIHRYGDDSKILLREKIAHKNNLSKDNIILGHGSNDVARTIFSTYLCPGDEVILAHPTFSFFAKDIVLWGAKPILIPLQNGIHDLDAMKKAINSKTKCIIIVDPNNPTSTCITVDAFEKFIQEIPPNIVLLVDQAYKEYMPNHMLDAIKYIEKYPQLIVLRTFSKIYGLASLRCGYAISINHIISSIEETRIAFNVSSLSIQAAIAALDDEEFLDYSKNMNNRGKEYLLLEFKKLGLRTYPSFTNFIAVSVPSTATHAFEYLLNKGIMVKNGDTINMPGYLRITIGTPQENAFLIQHFKDFISLQ